MESYEQRMPILEFLYEEPDVSLSVLSNESPNNLEELIEDAFDDLQRSHLQLCEHVAALASKNRELEACASMAAHDLKQPLSVIILISNLITTIPDITGDELKEYLGQIKSTAYKMDTIINASLLFATVSKLEAPVEIAADERMIMKTAEVAIKRTS
jgi:light-regulated signal transduction histidine kinase (bacteriophytochrome)